MPASSRKRNKGKDRRARKDAEKKDRVNKLWKGLLSNSGNKCRHGLNTTADIPSNHPVSIFMDDFFSRWANFNNTMDCTNSLLDTIKKQDKAVWFTGHNLELTQDILTRIGTNILSSMDKSNTDKTVDLVEAILVFETWRKTGNIDSVYNNRRILSKVRDLQFKQTISNSRDILKFYRKRTSCKCLKKMHLEARETIPKIGRCFHCREEMERVLLSMCSRCMVYQYCSRECQVTHWPEHKVHCDMYVNECKRYL